MKRSRLPFHPHSSPLHSPKQIIRLGLLLSLTVGLSSCGLVPAEWGLTFLRVTGQVRSIQAIESRPTRERTVYLQGTVGDRVPLIDGQVYQLEDATGSIWVVTADSTVEAGTDLLIKGRVHYQEMPELGDTMGEAYVEELSQLERTEE